MGEYAEMILDGTCCQACGEFIGDPVGYPRSCGASICKPEISLSRALRTSLIARPTAAAKRNARHNRERREAAKQRKPFECHCGKLFRTEGGMRAHQVAVHTSTVSLQHR